MSVEYRIFYNYRHRIKYEGGIMLRCILGLFLLTATSFPEFSKFRYFEHTPEQLVALFRDKPLEFVPGEKMKYSNVPPGLRGLGITFITVGLLALAFMCFSGIQL